MIQLLAFLLVFNLVSDAQFITNGDFEQELNIGWTQISSGANVTIDRNTNYDPDPDYEAYVYLGTGGGYAKLYQSVDIVTTNLDFSVNTKLYATATSTAWAGAAFVIGYLDDNSLLLGETRIAALSLHCPWVNSPTLHIIEAPDTLWNYYSFNINDELTNLTGINPADIKKIQVAMYDSSYDC